MRHCLSCALEYPDEKFCTNCGHRLEPGGLFSPDRKSSKDQCLSCGRVFRPDERFCGDCGLPYGKATAGVFRFYAEEDVAEQDAEI